MNGPLFFYRKWTAWTHARYSSCLRLWVWRIDQWSSIQSSPQVTDGTANCRWLTWHNPNGSVSFSFSIVVVFEKDTDAFQIWYLSVKVSKRAEAAAGLLYFIISFPEGTSSLFILRLSPGSQFLGLHGQESKHPLRCRGIPHQEDKWWDLCKSECQSIVSWYILSFFFFRRKKALSFKFQGSDI